ncbi:MAG TPA: ElyC/SanA/YdcF family protein [Verrucomicrobiae bacterium]|nr:ElyC/SanA/YdcF family protein [Verrucomicrobiae bacterium]
MKRRQCLAPTWRGCLALALLCVGLAIAAVLEIHPFLAVNDPLPGGLLMVEGWAPDYALEKVVAEVKGGHYEKVYVVGGPLQMGGPLSEYKTYAELGAATLVKLGLNSNQVQAVPAPEVRQDRTYAAAVSLRDWLRAHGISASKIYLISEGPHARRSRLLVERAFGNGVKVGVRSIPSRDYDARHWWRYSAGVRSVVDEAVAYVYARVFFRAH